MIVIAQRRSQKTKHPRHSFYMQDILMLLISVIFMLLVSTGKDQQPKDPRRESDNSTEQDCASGAVSKGV